MKKKEIRGSDFTQAELPRTRIAQFRDIMLNQWRTVLSTSFLLTLFALPLFADYLAFEVFIEAAYANGAEMNVIFSMFFYATLISIPCIIILSIGMSGSFEIAKKLFLGEGVILSSVFFHGLKANWKRGLVYGAICALSFALALLGSVYLSFYYQVAPIAVGIGIGLLIAQFIVIGIMTPYLFAQESVFANPLPTTIKNAFLLTLMKLPINFLLFLVAPGVFIVLLAINSVTAYIAIGLFVILNFVALLLWNSYIYRVFDLVVFKNKYPEMVGKGLAKKENESCPK